MRTLALKVVPPGRHNTTRPTASAWAIHAPTGAAAIAPTPTSAPFHDHHNAVAGSAGMTHAGPNSVSATLSPPAGAPTPATAPPRRP